MNSDKKSLDSSVTQVISSVFLLLELHICFEYIGGSSMKTGIIGAVVGGLSCLLLILSFFLWKRLRMSKEAGRGKQDELKQYLFKLFSIKNQLI